MNLHSDKEAFKEIIALAADHFGYEQSHVEKDYWVSKILRDISMSEYADKTYFKGGTSLSKAYGLIERFSEDLDLFVFTGDKGASKQAEKTLNKKLSKYIAELNMRNVLLHHRVLRRSRNLPHRTDALSFPSPYRW